MPSKEKAKERAKVRAGDAAKAGASNGNAQKKAKEEKQVAKEIRRAKAKAKPSQENASPVGKQDTGQPSARKVRAKAILRQPTGKEAAGGQQEVGPRLGPWTRHSHLVFT